MSTHIYDRPRLFSEPAVAGRARLTLSGIFRPCSRADNDAVAMRRAAAVPVNPGYGNAGYGGHRLCSADQPGGYAAPLRQPTIRIKLHRPVSAIRW